MTTPKKRALVTGASSGIGTALCRLLKEKGYDLVVTGRDEERLNAIAKEVEGTPIVADLSTPAGRSSLIAEMEDHCPDLLVNNAGYGLYGEVLSRPSKDWLEMIEVNVKALTELTTEGARLMVDRGIKGTIMNVSSVAAFFPFPHFATYAATKGYVNQFSEAVDHELRPKGVRVLAACPGQVATRFRSRAGGTAEVDTSKQLLPVVMTPEYAAEQVWLQLQSNKPIRIFNLLYRVLQKAQALAPKQLLLKRLSANITSRHP